MIIFAVVRRINAPLDVGKILCIGVFAEEEYLSLLYDITIKVSAHKIAHYPIRRNLFFVAGDDGGHVRTP